MTARIVWLPGADAATYAGVKPATLRQWKRRYGLTTHRLGEVTWFRMDELAAVLEGRV